MRIKITKDSILITSNDLLLHDLKKPIPVDISDYFDGHVKTFKIQLGEAPYETVENGKVHLKVLNNYDGNAIIRVKIVDLSTGVEEILEKEILLQQYINIGKVLKQPYVPVFQELLNRVENLEVALAKKLKEGDIE